VIAVEVWPGARTPRMIADGYVATLTARTQPVAGELGWRQAQKTRHA